MSYTFISGATGGIGKAFAIACAKKGDNLFLTGRTIGKLSALKGEILSTYKVAVEIFPCDFSSEKSRGKLLAEIDKNGYKFKRIINVAGVDIQKAFTDYTPEKIQFQMRVNNEATIFLTHALLARRDENAEVIFISSMSGVTPMPYFALYSATKALLINFSKALKTLSKSVTCSYIYSGRLAICRLNSLIRSLFWSSAILFPFPVQHCFTHSGKECRYCQDRRESTA